MLPASLGVLTNLVQSICEEVQINESYLKRAKAKWFQVPFLQHLIDLNSPFKDKYRHTITSCAQKITIEGGKTRSKYCKRPWCQTCNRIRTAVRLNAYSEPLKALGPLQLTTLTLPSVAAWTNATHKGLRDTVKFIRLIFRQFRNTWGKANNAVFRGVYNIEVTMNVNTRLYHPHIHIIHEWLPLHKTGLIFQNKKTGEEYQQTINELIEYWLLKCPTATIAAQDARECYELIEGFKYSNKGSMTKEINGKKVPIIMAIESDAMYQALHGVRMFQPFGIEKVLDEDKEMDELDGQHLDVPDGDYIFRLWDWEATFYVNPETGEMVNYEGENFDTVHYKLSGFTPNKKQIKRYEKLEENESYTIPNKHESTNLLSGSPVIDQSIWPKVWPIQSPERQSNVSGIFRTGGEAARNDLNDLRPL